MKRPSGKSSDADVSGFVDVGKQVYGATGARRDLQVAVDCLLRRKANCTTLMN